MSDPTTSTAAGIVSVDRIVISEAPDFEDVGGAGMGLSLADVTSMASTNRRSHSRNRSS